MPFLESNRLAQGAREKQVASDVETVLAREVPLGRFLPGILLPFVLQLDLRCDGRSLSPPIKGAKVVALFNHKRVRPDQRQTLSQDS